MRSSGSSNGVSLNGNGKEMEFLAPPISNGPRHRPMTPLRAIRGVLCLVIYLSTAFMMLVYWAPIATLLLRLFSVHYSRKATSMLFGMWLSLWPFLFEKINKTKVFFSGESVPRDGRVLLFANHRTEVDWMYVWDLALRKGRLGNIKYVLKRSLMKIPIFSWGFHIFEFISVERKWEVDATTMPKKLSTFKDARDPLWLAVFPEGTDYTEQKCIKSQQFAAENGLPILKNVLLPKTKGFYACVEALRNSLNAVYDITIAYKHRCPTFTDNVFGVDPSEVHIHVQRIPLHEIPANETKASAWLMERFRLKDQQLADFAAQGHFPQQGTEGDLPMGECLLKLSSVISLTCIFTYLTFCSSVWFKVYVALSCAYLTFITYFGVMPRPILGSAKALFRGKKTT
ncbi:putative 1-acyl-sn-glycerol-3-phosphate acyltransferase 4 isoform X1 [Iris pallida]|uniref:1-acylglycerol-3-phosphate O-acyltransferase n=1 Tax=Iris pallida TaxID=29817 RepID=A0AAX6F4W7_IRIPA|nr:putative 1-acyl-sn-glycerol-3-phosphate acyltransferase 4 isoform X1 [Iris pallida]